MHLFIFAAYFFFFYKPILGGELHHLCRRHFAPRCSNEAPPKRAAGPVGGGVGGGARRKGIAFSESLPPVTAPRRGVSPFAAQEPDLTNSNAVGRSPMGYSEGKIKGSQEFERGATAAGATRIFQEAAVGLRGSAGAILANTGRETARQLKKRKEAKLKAPQQ